MSGVALTLQEERAELSAWLARRAKRLRKAAAHLRAYFERPPEDRILEGEWARSGRWIRADRGQIRTRGCAHPGANHVIEMNVSLPGGLADWLRGRAKNARASAKHVRDAMRILRPNEGRDHYSEAQAVGYDLNATAYDRAAAAAQACTDYERWASEIRRLTAGIAACECPNQTPSLDDPTSGESCFKRASQEEFPGNQPDDGPTRRDLDAITAAVADCPSCSQLCKLIRRRRHARQRFGVAKREIRRIGRITLAETPRA